MTRRARQRDELVKGLAFTAADMVEEGGYEIASLAARFTEKSNELASVRSTADTQTRWILSPPMREDLKKTGRGFSQAERASDDGLCDPAGRTHADA